VTAVVVVDAAGAWMGGAARYLDELRSYLARAGREDVQVIGSARGVSVAWLARRELRGRAVSRRVALNNVGFLTPGGQRWTLLRNALHFLSEDEQGRLDVSLRAAVRRQAAAVHLAARRSDVLVAPSTAMADRVCRVLPSVRGRVVVRPHPVSADSVPRLPREDAILAPVLFAPYKGMAGHLFALLAVLDEQGGSRARLRVTADPREVPARLAQHPRVELLGRRTHQELRDLQARSRALYFPTSLESFGWPLAEARVSGQPVIARDTAHNREIAGAALCGFATGDVASLRHATALALARDVLPDPAAFQPDAYFNWLLGPPR
jgi:glycosyltransferase involved in cell wall biosynthesis